MNMQGIVLVEEKRSKRDSRMHSGDITFILPPKLAKHFQADTYNLLRYFPQLCLAVSHFRSPCRTELHELKHFILRASGQPIRLSWFHMRQRKS